MHRGKPFVDDIRGPDCFLYSNRRNAEIETVIERKIDEMKERQAELYKELDKPNLSEEDGKRISMELNTLWENMKATIKELYNSD